MARSHQPPWKKKSSPSIASVFASPAAIGALIVVLVAVAAGLGTWAYMQSGPSKTQVAKATDRQEKKDPPTVKGDERPEAAPAQKEEQAAVEPNDCDRLALDPRDPNTPDGATPVEDAYVPAKRAIDVCKGEAQSSNNSAEDRTRFEYNGARAAYLSGRRQEAMKVFAALCDKKGYGMGCLQLALAYKQGIAGLPADSETALDYAQKASEKGVTAASAIVDELEAQSPLSKILVSGVVRNIIRGTISEIPDTFSTRRYVFTLVYSLNELNGRWYKGQLSVQDKKNLEKMIIPVWEQRINAAGSSSGKMGGDWKSEGMSGDFRSWLIQQARRFTDAKAMAYAVTTVQVRIGVQDAQVLQNWLENCNCTGRQKFMSTQSELLQAWADSQPRPDNEAAFRALVREDQRKNVKLPLDDHNDASLLTGMRNVLGGIFGQQ